MKCTGCGNKITEPSSLDYCSTCQDTGAERVLEELFGPSEVTITGPSHPRERRFPMLRLVKG